MLNARTGAVLGTTRVGFATALAVDARAGHVLVANASFGTVSLLDTHSGALLRTVEVGGSPAAVAVDTRTSRAFVTGSGTLGSIALHHLGKGQLSWAGEWNNTNIAVLDTRDGTVLGTVPVAAGRGLAMDERAGRAFATTWDRNTLSTLDATQ